MVIVITDGESSDLEGGLATQVGQALKAQKILVYGISVRNEPAAEDLRTVCQITGGQLFESGDSAALRAVFRKIDQLQRAKLVSAQTQWLEFNQPFAITGLILLSMTLLAAFGLRFTPW